MIVPLFRCRCGCWHRCATREDTTVSKLMSLNLIRDETEDGTQNLKSKYILTK